MAADTDRFDGQKTGHGYYVAGMAFSPDGKTLASASYDKTVKIWDTATGSEVLSLPHSDSVYTVAFSPDGLYTASGGWDGTVHIWDAQTGDLKQSLRHGEKIIDCLAYSPDGRNLAVAVRDENDSIRLWDLQTGVLKKKLHGHGQV